MGDRSSAIKEIYEAYRLSRQKARELIKRQISDVLDFLDEEEEIFEQAAQNIKRGTFHPPDDDE